MTLRVDMILWAAAALLSVTAGLWQWVSAVRPSTRRPRRTWRLMLIAASLLALLAGIVWHPWRGSTSDDALAVLAAGALFCGLWEEWRKTHLPDELQPAADRITGLALTATGLLIAAAAMVAWREPWQAGPSETQRWLFGVRMALAGLGLGGWLYIAAAALGGLLATLSTERRGSLEAASTAADDVASVADAGLRFSYPWLGAALVAGAAWSLTVFAVPWRGQPAEIWLAANALIGAGYLHRPAQGWPASVRFVTYALAVAGLATALLAAWHAPTLYS